MISNINYFILLISRVFKKYSNVPFDYGTFQKSGEEEDDDEVKDGRGRVLSLVSDPEKQSGHKEKDTNDDSDKVKF